MKAKKKKIPVFKLLFFIAACGLIFGSYKYSEKLYGFYTTAYYKHIKHFTADDIRVKADNLLAKDKRDECRNFLKNMTTVFANDALELAAIGGAYLKMGEKTNGIAVLIRALDKGLSPQAAEAIIPELAKDGCFGEIRAILQDRQLSGYMRGFYGIALYYTEDWKGAANELEAAIAEEGNDAVLLYCLSQANAKMGDKTRAVSAMETAYKLAPKNKTIKVGLMDLYQQYGRRDKAAALLREWK